MNGFFCRSEPTLTCPKNRPANSASLFSSARLREGIPLFLAGKSDAFLSGQTGRSIGFSSVTYLDLSLPRSILPEPFTFLVYLTICFEFLVPLPQPNLALYLSCESIASPKSAYGYLWRSHWSQVDWTSLESLPASCTSSSIWSGLPCLLDLCNPFFACYRRLSVFRWDAISAGNLTQAQKSWRWNVVHPNAIEKFEESILPNQPPVHSGVVLTFFSILCRFSTLHTTPTTPMETLTECWAWSFWWHICCHPPAGQTNFSAGSISFKNWKIRYRHRNMMCMCVGVHARPFFYNHLTLNEAKLAYKIKTASRYMWKVKKNKLATVNQWCIKHDPQSSCCHPDQSLWASIKKSPGQCPTNLWIKTNLHTNNAKRNQIKANQTKQTKLNEANQTKWSEPKQTKPNNTTLYTIKPSQKGLKLPPHPSQTALPVASRTGPLRPEPMTFPGGGLKQEAVLWKRDQPGGSNLSGEVETAMEVQWQVFLKSCKFWICLVFCLGNFCWILGGQMEIKPKRFKFPWECSFPFPSLMSF